jgi:nucleoside-diphosphate-sugar epimerase
MRVAILGCGYVGLELGRRLVDAGHRVVGVRRSESGLERVETAGLEPVEADVTDPTTLTPVPDVDAVVFAASAGGRGSVAAARRTYVEGLRGTLAAFGERSSPPDRLVYTSSTGVYGDHGGQWVDEDTDPEPGTERGEVLLEAESVALGAAESGIDGTVVRFAGLYGPDRYRLERYLEGPVTEGWLNLLHRDDAAGVVEYLLSADLARGEVILGVDDEPVEKWALADWLAEQCGRSPPPKRTTAERLAEDDLSTAARARIRANKRCSNAKLRGLGYEFEYPTYREGYRDATAAYGTPN